MSYHALSDSYQEIALSGGDIDMREESMFKYVLLESLHGEAVGALQALTGFQRKFPRGVYATVVRVMREVLVGQVYHERQWDKDPAALIRFVEEHPDCAERSLQVGHLTGSAWIVDRERKRTLLTHHR